MHPVHLQASLYSSLLFPFHDHYQIAPHHFGLHLHFLHFLILSQHHYFLSYPPLHYFHPHSHFHHYYCFHFLRFHLHFHWILSLHFLLVFRLLFPPLVLLVFQLLFLFHPIYHQLLQVCLEHLLLRQLMLHQYRLSFHVNSLLFSQIDQHVHVNLLNHHSSHQVLF